MEISRSLSGNGPSAAAETSVFEWSFLENARPGWLIAFPAIVLLLMSIPNLATGYWADEVFSITASRSLSGLFRMFRQFENNMSLYQVILYFWMRLFGESETATHMLSLVVALATLPLFYQLERMWFNKTTSFFGLLLLSVSRLFVYDAVETRSYAMLILCVTLSTLLFVRLLRNPRYGLAVAYGFAVGISTYIHYFGVLIPLVHVFLLTKKTLTKKYMLLFVCAGVVAALVVSPLVLFPPQSKSQVDWITAPPPLQLWFVFSALFGTGYVMVLLAVCLFFVFKNGHWKNGAAHGFLPEKLAVVWAFIPVLFIYVFSNLVKPLFVIRFFAWIVPGATLFTTLVVTYTTRNRWIQTALWFLVLGIFVFKSLQFFGTKGAGFRDSVQYLRKNIKPGDAVLVYPYFWTLDVNYYLDQAGRSEPAARPVPIASSPYLGGGGGRDPLPDLEVVQQTAHRAGRVYLVCSGNTVLSKGDTLQQRVWLPRITELISAQHAGKKEYLFGQETQNPIRVLVFE